MTKKELEKVIFGQKQRWESGVKVSIALVIPDNPLGQKTAETFYEMSPKEIKSYWRKLGFQNQHPIARFLSSEEEVVKFVEETSGAIGIVSSTAEINAKLKVSLID